MRRPPCANRAITPAPHTWCSACHPLTSIGASLWLLRELTSKLAHNRAHNRGRRGRLLGQQGPRSLIHRVWSEPSTTGRLHREQPGPRTGWPIKGTTWVGPLREVVRARPGSPSSRAGGGHGRQRGRGLHRQRAGTRHGKESGLRADAGAEGPRDLQGPVRLSGASGPPTGRPYRPPQRSGRRGRHGAARTSGPPR